MARKSKNIRTSVILDKDQYRKLVATAERNDVSVAWVIRHAMGKFLEEYGNKAELPLLFGKEKLIKSA